MNALPKQPAIPNPICRLLVIAFTLAIGIFASSTTTTVADQRQPVILLQVASGDFSAAQALMNQITALSPRVRADEAARVTECVYDAASQLRRDYGVVWPPLFNNFLINSGIRKRGLCFQWATELLRRLEALKLETLELHWAESFERTMSEHNVIVVTAKGQPFQQGILLDNWRFGGRLIWGPVTGDPHYEWKENKAEAVRRLRKK